MRADDSTLARLMAQAQGGDRPSYTVLLVEAGGLLRRMFATRIADGELDDLVQDTLISLHRKMASYDPTRPFIPWLMAIARYRWVDRLRRTYRAKETAFDKDFPASADEDSLTSRVTLNRLFKQLPDGQARAIRLVRIEGRSIAEVAAETGQSESLVKVNVHRGLKKLALLVEEE